MVVTDSQAFAVVSKIVPEDIPLTSFSILMARYKGFLETAVRGASALTPSSETATRFSSPRAARTTGSAGILEP